MTQFVEPAAPGIMGGGDIGQRLLRDDLLYSAIGLCAVHLSHLLREPLIHYGQILLSGIRSEQILTEDLERTQFTQQRDAISYGTGTSGVAK